MNDRSQATATLAPWKILIADDDRDVHAATRMALRGIRFRGRALEFIDAYSGAETLLALQEHPDTAIVFLDVIMETDDAGLAAARRIRENGFNLVRIIVRTGFPGQAPERKVIVDYDIHDYKEKTGLTVQKLFTSVISALRAYDDLVELENHRRGLMSVLEAVSWFDFNAVQRYVCGMLAEFSNLAKLGAERVIMVVRPSGTPEEAPVVVAALGEWDGADEIVRLENLGPAAAELVIASLNQRQGLSVPAAKTLYSHNHGIDLVVLTVGEAAFAQTDTVLLDVFLNKVCQAVSNLKTFADMADDRDAVLRGLALRAECWNDNAAVELDGLARLVAAIALRLDTMLSFPFEIDGQFLRDIRIAALLHDLGNESIPSDLLRNNTSYEPEERKLMQTHVAAGIQALRLFSSHTSNSGALNLARDIIGGHHEHFDGSGYPAGLRGEAISLAARLVAVADAYIAMISPRPYRPAMDSSAACVLIEAGAGRQFDPLIVEAFLAVHAQT